MLLVPCGDSAGAVHPRLVWMFDPTNSAFNYTLKSMGFNWIPWLSDPYWARFSVILVNVWYWRGRSS